MSRLLRPDSRLFTRLGHAAWACGTDGVLPVLPEATGREEDEGYGDVKEVPAHGSQKPRRGVVRSWGAVDSFTWGFTILGVPYLGVYFGHDELLRSVTCRTRGLDRLGAANSGQGDSLKIMNHDSLIFVFQLFFAGLSHLMIFILES